MKWYELSTSFTLQYFIINCGFWCETISICPMSKLYSILWSNRDVFVQEMCFLLIAIFAFKNVIKKVNVVLKGFGKSSHTDAQNTLITNQILSIS